MSKTPEAVKDDKEPGKAGPPAKPPAPEQAAFAVGKLTLSELYKITGPKMLDAAVKAFTLYEEREFERAEKAFRALAVLNPKEPYYMTALGATYLQQDKLDDALRSFTYSIALSSGKDIAAYVNRGEVYLQKNMVKEAASDFKAAVEIEPTSNDGVAHRARVLWAAAMDDLQSNGSATSAQAEKPAETSEKAGQKPSKSKKKK